MNVDKRYWYLLTVSVIVLLSFPAAYIVASYSTFTFFKIAQFLTPVGSLILTITLAFLYLSLSISQERQTELVERQTEIQENQNQILERQVTLTQTRYEPDIEILESSAVSDSQLQSEEGDLYSVTLVNKGEGVGNRLNLWCELLYYDGEEIVPINEVDLDSEDSAIHLRPSLNSLLAANHIDSQKMQYYGGYLGPGESSDFEGIVGFFSSERGIPAEAVRFSEALQILRENTISNLDAHLWLVYTDQTGQTHYSKVDSGHFDVFQVEDFADAISGPPGHFKHEDEGMIERIEELDI